MNTKPLTIEEAKEIANNVIESLNSCIICYVDKGYVETILEENVRVRLNNLLESDNLHCTDFFITNNIDKPLFGIYVLPNISDYDIAKIKDDEDISSVRFGYFRIEVDIKLFSQSYTVKEIFAMMLCDIYGMMAPDAALKIRTGIEACVCNTGRAAAGYIIKPISKKHEYAVLRYVFVSFLRNLYTFAGDDQIIIPFETNHIVSALGLDIVIRDIYRDRNITFKPGSEINMFRWAFNLLDDFDLHLSDAIDTLATIKSTTGSKLEYNLLSATLEALKSGVDMDTADKYVKESYIMEFSLFKSLKTNGLRGIEDDLYEYKIRIKNCEDEEDAMYILRQINTRLTILDDYVRNEDELSERERQRWNACIDSYKDLRYQLGQKKIGGKKQYGIFIDYDKLDQL